MVQKQKARPSGAAPGRAMEPGRAGKSGLQVQGHSITSDFARQFRTTGKAACW